jgi:hypothetical protein
MHQGYFDGSGTHDGSSILCIAGFIGEQAAFADLDRRWSTVLDKPCWPTRLSEFHMVDCVHGNGEFREGRWSYAERLALYGDLAGAIVESSQVSSDKLIAVGAGVITDIFTKIPQADLDLLKAEGLGTPFDLTFQLLLQQTIHKMNDYWPGEKVAFLYDDGNKPEADRFLELCQHYSAHFYLDALGGWGQSDSKNFAALQAADLFAFGTLHLAQLNHYPINAEPYFPTIPAFWSLLSGIVADGGIYDLGALNLLLPKIRAKERILTKQELAAQ